MRHGTFAPVVLTALSFTLAGSQAWAQTPRPFRLSLGGGMTFVTGEDRTYFSDGFNIAGAVRVNVPAAGIGLRFEVSYSDIGSKDEMDMGDTLVLGDFNVIGGTVSAMYNLGLPAPTRPYILFGGGMFRTEASATLYGTPRNGATTDFGVTAGLGMNFRAGYIELRVHNIFGDGGSARLYPVTVGLIF
jgi:hypothetical protein